MAHQYSFSPRLNAAFPPSSPLIDMAHRHLKLRLLVVATGPRDTSWAQTLVVRLSNHQQIEIKAIVDDVVPRLMQTTIVMQNQSLAWGVGERTDDIEFYRHQAFELVEWADLMVCVPLDVDAIAKMLLGVTDSFIGEVLRGWNPQKNIILVPGMSTHMWANPMTKKHLTKIRRKWSWIRLIAPILWHYEGVANPKRIPNWNGFNEVLGIIKNQAELLGLGRDIVVPAGISMISESNGEVHSKLPPEIWTIILDYAGDWEIAKALGIYTNLKMPSIWTLQPRDPSDALKVYEHSLEWTVLTRNSAAICKKLSQSPPSFRDISALVIKLIIKFGLIDVLKYIEANRPDLFKGFDGTTLPTKASAYYPRTDVLDYWKHSLWFKDRHVYDAEAVDGASKNGHVRVLDWWWRQSILPLRYTETALEQASGNGHLLVLEWWRDAAAQDDHIVLRPGRSLLWATQYGQAEVLQWWDVSGIPIAHGDSVPKMASRWGQVEVLETWRRLKGNESLRFDEEVLVSATIHQHIGVLDWWRKYAHGELEGMQGLRRMVEFRTCNIEEALKEATGDSTPVRRWWMESGLNLGLRTDEGLRTRYL